MDHPYRIPPDDSPAGKARARHLRELTIAGDRLDKADAARTEAQEHLNKLVVAAHGPAAQGGLSYKEIGDTQKGRGKGRIRAIAREGRDQAT